MDIVIGDQITKTDDQGFLLNPEDWTKEVGLELVKRHEADGHKKVTQTGWMLINYFHDFYEDHMRHPTMNEIIRDREKHDGKDFEKEEHDYKEFLYELFPHGPIPMLAKLAGLPREAVAKEMED